MEKTGTPVVITRRGKVVARLQPPPRLSGRRAEKPWERLRAMGGRLLAQPGESVFKNAHFDALR
jgi:antitoxin (DNA-binding transcriptional repressor) of toxin-antitoxin stability system